MYSTIKQTIKNIVILCAIVGLAEFIKDKIYHKKYSHIFDLIKEKNNIDICGYYNSNIYPLKQQVDTLEASKKYLPKKNLRLVNAQQENLKELIQELDVTYQQMIEDSKAYTMQIRQAILNTEDPAFKKYEKLKLV